MITGILVTIIIICLLLAIGVLKYNKYSELIIRINEAEANIDAILNKRFDLLNKSVGIIKSVTNTDKEILESIVKLRSRKLNYFELDKQLAEAYLEFNCFSNRYEELKNSETFLNLEMDLIESESIIIALKNYYNDISKKYNKLIKIFPSNIVGKIKGYKTKQLFEFNNTPKEDLINSPEIIFEDEK